MAEPPAEPESRDPASAAGRSADDLARESEVMAAAFLRGEAQAVAAVLGWTRAVTSHEAWGFEASEDVAQATLLALVQNLREGRFQAGNLKAYVRRIAKNMCINNYDRMRSRGPSFSLDEGMTPVVADSGETIERRALLDRILDRLSEECREILVMAYIQGLSRKEIGARLSTSEQTARVRLFRCIRDARARLKGNPAGGDQARPGTTPESTP